ncbi:MAG: CYTH and CHAD domain-containing protein [Gammaproteobacteria bacterium]|nr:CYTH and CHAD domain-containing protein [Gammaproteobacteria bacterium]MBU1647204.1 CYTH and CHAD domain-containing protein [Gammaproteobacteria bacterium]MBU1972716.1 CYTH and CHAD domain-containing protein [Gammaproteobacteria bacterium]
MPTQIALKLGLPEASQALFVRHPLLRRAASRRNESLVSIYYDTRRLDLHRKAISLRLRKQGDGWLQTVKHNAESEGGLTTRPEWDTPYLNHFDFSAIDDAAVRARLEKPRVAQGLTALFETSFRRTIWQLHPAPGSTVLVMLDRGWIASNGRRAPISEVELELVSGSPARLYEVAFELAARIPLTPELISKAERGYRLASDTKGAPVRATAAPIAAADHPLVAFRAIALNCLAHLHLNHAGALRDGDPEYVHQMRVATRRLRAAMRMFAPVLPADFVAPLVPPLRELMTTLGRTRDLDVLLAEIVGPVSAALADDPRISALAGILTDRLYATREETVDFLARPGYGHLQLQAAALLHGKALIEPPPPDAEQPATLLDFARRRLRKLQRDTHHLAELARIDDPAALHQLRIAIKRLRYALEFFGPLLPRRSFTTASKQLATLQDKLGQLNDLANAGAVLMACAGSDPALREAVALIGGWHGPRHAALLASVPDQLEVVRKLRLPKLK